MANTVQPDMNRIQYEDNPISDEKLAAIKQQDDLNQERMLAIFARLNAIQMPPNPPTCHRSSMQHGWTILGLGVGLSIVFTITKLAVNLSYFGLAINSGIVTASILIGRHFDQINNRQI